MKTTTLTFTLIFFLSPLYAQISEFKITASDGAAGDYFGASISISGDYSVVGVYKDDDNGSMSGSAYVFKRTGTSWVEEAKLLPSDGAADDLFGWSVSISGDYIVVGAAGDDDNGNNSGSAYVFKRAGTSWVQEVKLLPSDGTISDVFGNSVSISGDYAVVGARSGNNTTGLAYVFKRTGTSWAEEAKLLASDGAAGDNFGKSISISGDYSVVGANFDDDNGSASGSAYVFKRTDTSWAQEAKLLASDGAVNDFFGYSVSISGDYAVVGARLDDDNGFDSGSAYVFKRTGTIWTQEAKLLASDGAAFDEFGNSVSISGDYTVVGAAGDDDNGNNSGSAYVFKRTGTSWTQEAKLLASDGASNDQFGYSVSISGGYAVVGAWLDDHSGIDSGSAYVYKGITSLLGDLNGDGVLDVLDAILMIELILNNDYDAMGDMNGDGTINIFDVIILINEILGRNTAIVKSDSPAKVIITSRMENNESVLDVTFEGDIAGLQIDMDAMLSEDESVILGQEFSNMETQIRGNSDGTRILIYSLEGQTLIGNGRLLTYKGQLDANSIKVLASDSQGNDIPVEFISGHTILNEFRLEQNHPNPFNPETVIEYALPKASDVSLVIYNLRGEEVARLVEGERVAGYHRVTWDASNVASGVYFYRLRTGEFVETRKMVLLR